MRLVVLAVLMLAAPVAHAQDVSTSSPAYPQPGVLQPAPQVPVAAAPAAPAPVVQPAAEPLQYVQPAPQPPVQVVQPAPQPPVQYVQPAPPPVQYVQPAPAPVQYVQPAPAPVQYAQPAPPPVQYVQPAQVPAVQYVQPSTPYVVMPPAPAQAAPAYTWPAPPPGYVYVPVTAQVTPGNEAVSRNQLYDELHRTELQLDGIESRRLKLGAPITFMALGYGTMLISVLVAATSVAAAEDIEHARWDDYDDGEDDWDYDVTGDGVVDADDEQQLRRQARGFAAVAGVGLLVGAISTFRLVSKVHQRKELRAEKAALTQKRARLRQELDYGVGATSQAMQVTVSGRY